MVKLTGLNKKVVIAIIFIVFGFLSTISYLVLFYGLTKTTPEWILVLTAIFLSAGPICLIIGIIELAIFLKIKRISGIKRIEKQIEILHKIKKQIKVSYKIVEAKEKKRELIVKEKRGRSAEKKINQLDEEIHDYLSIIEILKELCNKLDENIL